MPKTMLSTTLSADLTAQAQQIPLASVSGLKKGDLLFVDREAISVLADPISNTCPLVYRGVQGTPAQAHLSGATVYYGPPQSFGLADPSGKFPTDPDIWLPLVVIPTGNVWNDDNGVWTLQNGGGGGSNGPSGSASLNFPEIADGGIAELTFTLNGVIAGERIAPAWPASLDAGLTGSMFASATNTITVRLVNLSGAPINLGALTFGAQAVR